jgi:hypothetical protein
VFKDFLLTRIVEIGKQGLVTADPQADLDWHNEIVLQIGPLRTAVQKLATEVA